MKRQLPFAIIFTLLWGVALAQYARQDLHTVIKELQDKADSGDAKSIFNLARLYETGYDSLPRDLARALSLYLRSANEGYAPARNFIGFKYYNGDGVVKNLDSALYWIRLAAEDGDITAASNLGYLLSQSPEITHDYEEAISWLSKAAEASVPSALSQLADLKRQGLGGPKDTMEAVSLYEKASDAGDREAQLKLLSMMGYKWKELPADSALSLGLKYYKGSAPVAGVDLLENAAKSHNSKAMALLGDAYSKGIGVNYDHEKSIYYFYEAACGGDASAQFIIAELLDFFPDALKYKAEGKEQGAAYWYEKAALSGINDSETAYERLFSLP